MIVAIDGPSGVGKSSTAKALAKELGVPYLDTGAMYRAIGHLVLSEGGDLDDEAAVMRLLGDHEITLESDGSSSVVCVDGRRVGDEIRTSAVSDATSRVAVHPAVRAEMVTLQRRFAEQWGGVLEGRDIGTVVFPDTPHKFFLDASPETRARRRWEQLREAGEAHELASLEEEMRERDRRDRSRGASPLREDPTYFRLDSSELTFEEVVEALARRVRSLELREPTG